MTHDLNQYRFGVNYTPTRSWWYCWNDFQSEAIAKDLDTIAAIGADHIRIMLMWPYFQPNPWTVSEIHLQRLDTLMTLANDRELDVCVTLFVGWLSGYAFKPPYQQDESFYMLADNKDQQQLYIRSIADVMKQHNNFLGFDLGNELNCCWKATETAIGDQWNNEMLKFAATCLPEAIHVNGVDHNPWFHNETFSPQNLALSQQVIPLHCWTYFTKAYQRSQGNCLHPRCVRLPEAMAALARSYAGNSCKPIWIQEYGISEDWTDQENIPRFLRESTLNAIESGVNWFTWWCSHDLDTKYKFADLEYSLGLIDVNQNLKPQAYVFKELAETYGGSKAINNCSNNLPPPTIHNNDNTWKWLDKWIGVSD